ncbi:uncharacterized protein MICPUCDRAFT_42116 [Micromonas pusilla CCMP1545]|uniref:Predicted protein n=1 Tax=Micromonas pusilla (strain CCMP1545) TaxID=564608 RepID=C1N351_MICPC|nr:uncharacterized protein MICPUCDRAFT_42116 [Micromonas pusilla CCMP1545]EEH53137.1 predicted protein [Micromonas pusilla CCMP1545]|eukprot:XP_003062318.1 predicted protein [Micromonas pusilla CCMP1545]
MSAFTVASSVASLASRASYALARVASRRASRAVASSPPSSRRPLTLSPVCMGRKAAKVAAKKQKGEAKRTKLYGKYGKLIVAAVKEGGGADPVSNTQLARVLADAARLSVPRELVDRNIKRATDGSQADYMELTYEAYGEGGVGIVIEVLSDNVNRAAADTKATINKNGGKVAEPGSGAFYTLEENVFEVACENGGDDVVPREDGEDGFTIYTEVQGFMQCQRALGDAGFEINPDETALKMIPLASVEVSDEAAEVNEALVEKLLELEDVDAVYTQ